MTSQHTLNPGGSRIATAGLWSPQRGVTSCPVLVALNVLSRSRLGPCSNVAPLRNAVSRLAATILIHPVGPSASPLLGRSAPDLEEWSTACGSGIRDEPSQGARTGYPAIRIRGGTASLSEPQPRARGRGARHARVTSPRPACVAARRSSRPSGRRASFLRRTTSLVRLEAENDHKRGDEGDAARPRFDCKRTVNTIEPDTRLMERAGGSPS